MLRTITMQAPSAARARRGLPKVKAPCAKCWIRQSPCGVENPCFGLSISPSGMQCGGSDAAFGAVGQNPGLRGARIF